MKKIKLLSLALANVLLAATAYAADFNLNVNSSLTIDDPMFKGLQQFKDGVEKNSGGKISVKLFPSSQLGSDEDVLEQARSGAGVAQDGGRRPSWILIFLNFGYSAMFPSWISSPVSNLKCLAQAVRKLRPLNRNPR